MRCTALVLAFLLALPPTVSAAEPLPTRVPELTAADVNIPDVGREPLRLAVHTEAISQDIIKPGSDRMWIVVGIVVAATERLLFLVLPASGRNPSSSYTGAVSGNTVTYTCEDFFVYRK